jgi:hypothetical protein
MVNDWCDEFVIRPGDNEGEEAQKIVREIKPT